MTSKRRLWICHGEEVTRSLLSPHPTVGDSLLGLALPPHMYLRSHDFYSLLLSMGDPRKRSLICWVCSWRWNVVPDLGRRHCILLRTRWVTVQPDAIFFEWKFKHPWDTNTGFPTKLCPKGGKKKASNLDINKCTKSRVTFHKPAVFLPKRETFFQCGEVFASSLTLGGIDYLYVPG